MWFNGLWLPGGVADWQLENQGARGEGMLEGEPGKYNHQAIYHLRTRRFILQRKSTIMPLVIFNQGGAYRKRFATLAKWLPFLPVFGGGVVRFQYVSNLRNHSQSADGRPVYAGDIARAVEICCRDDKQVIDAVGGRVIEAGGPEGIYIPPDHLSFLPLPTIDQHKC